MRRIGTVQVFKQTPHLTYIRASDDTVRRALQWPRITKGQLRNRLNYLNGGASLICKGPGLWLVQGDTQSMAAALARMQTTPQPIRAHFELTDLFNGEANYSWVRRHQMSIPCEDSEDMKTFDRRVVRLAKAWVGWTGWPCRTENMGDGIRIDARPSGVLQVLFITFEGGDGNGE